MAQHVLAYNLTRVMNIVGKPGLIAAIRPPDGRKCVQNRNTARDTHFGRSLDDTTRQRRPPTMIGDHSRVRPVCLHTTKTQSGQTGVAQWPKISRVA
jgi:hypothetical protein